MISRLLFDPNLPTEALFGELALAALVVIVAGTRFTRLADTLADRLHLEAGWIGLILVATVTSLPELVTSGTATWLGNVDMALGAIFGSCCFNITIICLLNALWGGGSVLRSVSESHSLTSSFGLALIGLGMLGVILAEKFAGRPRVMQLAEILWAVTIVVTYIGCMRLVYRYERNRTAGSAAPAPLRSGGNGMLYAQVALVATILVAASWWLANLGDILSGHTIEALGRPLGATFVGAFFLAFATSLPEIVTSVAAVRLGKLDLALGNIFGSNMFNIFVIPMLKGVSLVRGDALLFGADAARGTQNLVTGLLAVLLTAIAVGSLAYKSHRKLLRRFGFDSILIFVVYVGGMLLLMVEGR